MSKDFEPGEWSPDAEARQPRRFIGGLAPDANADMLAARPPAPMSDAPVNTRDPATERAWIIQHLGGNRSRQLGTDAMGRDLNAPMVAAPLVTREPSDISRLAAERIFDRSNEAAAAMNARFDPPGAYKSIPRDQPYTGQFAVPAPPQPQAPAPVAPAAPPGPVQPTEEERRRAAGEQLLSSSLSGMFRSDERVKTAVERASHEEQDATLRGIHGKTFDYDAEAVRDGAPADRRIGTTTQDLSATPLGGMVVHDTPKGQVVDRDQALGMNLALLGRVGERLDALERGRGKRNSDDGMVSDSNRKEAIAAVGKDKVDEALRRLARTATEEFSAGPGGKAQYYVGADRRDRTVPDAEAGDRVTVRNDPRDLGNEQVEARKTFDGRPSDYTNAQQETAEYTVGPGGKAQFEGPRYAWEDIPRDVDDRLFNPGAQVLDPNVMAPGPPSEMRPAPPAPAPAPEWSWRNAEFSAPPPGQSPQYADRGTPVRGDEVVGDPQRAHMAEDPPQLFDHSTLVAALRRLRADGQDGS